MNNKYIFFRNRNKDEGEKPFWISFADLMSALMVMFLLVMSVALLAVTDNATSVEQEQTQLEKSKAERNKEIDLLMARIEQAAKNHPGIFIDRNRNAIDFGERARFDTGSSRLSIEQAQYLSSFVSEVLSVSRDPLGQKWIKNLIVEGFADQRGDYLLNLDLSLQRSQRVLCVLLAPPAAQKVTLNPEEQEQVRDLFLVGGYSFNSAKKSLEESRRIELRLEFYRLDEPHAPLSEIPRGNFGSCRI